SGAPFRRDSSRSPPPGRPTTPDPAQAAVPPRREAATSQAARYAGFPLTSPRRRPTLRAYPRSRTRSKMTLLRRLFATHGRYPVRGRRRRTRPALEVLEARAVPAQFLVNSLADSGSGSLRQAVPAANLNPGADEITFASGVGK